MGTQPDGANKRMAPISDCGSVRTGGGDDDVSEARGNPGQASATNGWLGAVATLGVGFLLGRRVSCWRRALSSRDGSGTCSHRLGLGDFVGGGSGDERRIGFRGETYPENRDDRRQRQAADALPAVIGFCAALVAIGSLVVA